MTKGRPSFLVLFLTLSTVPSLADSREFPMTIGQQIAQADRQIRDLRQQRLDNSRRQMDWERSITPARSVPNPRSYLAELKEQAAQLDDQIARAQRDRDDLDIVKTSCSRYDQSSYECVMDGIRAFSGGVNSLQRFDERRVSQRRDKGGWEVPGSSLRYHGVSGRTGALQGRD